MADCSAPQINYIDTYCKTGQPNQHSGQDINTTQGYTGLRVVAAMGGIVDARACEDGAGDRIKIIGTDGRYYRYYHLARNSYQVSQGQTVVAGQLLATMGTTDSCTTSAVGLHLHFDRTDSKACNTPGIVCGRDTYLSLRATHARPGLMENGSTIDNAIYARWLQAIAPFGSNFGAAMLFVGWPGNGSYNLKANAITRDSMYGVSGNKQLLSTGVYGDTHWRSGVLVHVAAYSSAAFLVTAGYFPVYVANNQQLGYLGWPLTDAITNVPNPYQLFEGGCIFSNGGNHQAYPWGSGPC